MVADSPAARSRTSATMSSASSSTAPSWTGRAAASSSVRTRITSCGSAPAFLTSNTTSPGGAEAALRVMSNSVSSVLITPSAVVGLAELAALAGAVELAADGLSLPAEPQPLNATRTVATARCRSLEPANTVEPPCRRALEPHVRSHRCEVANHVGHVLVEFQPELVGSGQQHLARHRPGEGLVLHPLADVARLDVRQALRWPHERHRHQETGQLVAGVDE